MFTVLDKEGQRQRRHARIRKKLVGTAEKPRLSVHRSHKNLFIQLIDDIQARTLFAFSTQMQQFREAHPKGGNVDAAKKLGELAAPLLKKKGFERIVYDRGGYLYHGRVRALAEALREGGIQF